MGLALARPNNSVLSRNNSTVVSQLLDKHQCTKLQGVNVAASIQMYAIYIPHGPKSCYYEEPMGTYPEHYSIHIQFVGIGINLMDDAKIDTNTSGSSTPNINGVVFLNPPQSRIAARTHLSRFSPCEDLVRVTLNQEHLVNMIELEDAYLRPVIDESEVGVHKMKHSHIKSMCQRMEKIG